MNVLIPDREVLETIHEVVINLTGGKDGVHDEKLLKSALERPRTFVGYQDDYDINTICALLIDSIARYHGFKDGNKRTALMTAFFTYRINGVHFRATKKMNEDFDNLVMWVVISKPRINDIVEKLVDLRNKHEGSKATWTAMIDAFQNSKIPKRHKD